MKEADTLPPPPGPDRSFVAGKYRLTRLLGRGGMGAVWEGVHETLGTRVAVKIIEIEYVESPDFLRRFENEAHAAARLQSKHVVEVYDHGVMHDGRAFIVMQYLQGEPLDKRLERLQRLSPQETARIVLQICRALSKAHGLGIVHRDLKPENIFLVWDEEDGGDIVKVVDFGIAKFIANTSEVAGTHTGSVLGTPFYMSPEQARGLRTVDHRSDLWSVGVIAFRCMVGRLPFEGEAVGDVLVKLCTGPIPVPSEIAPDLPAGFDAWMEHALSREIPARFSSAAALAESLATLCGIPVRPAYTTGDIPIQGSGDGELVSVSPGPIITPSYPHGQLRTTPTLASSPTPIVRTTHEGSTSGALTNTPTPAVRRGRTSLLAVLVVGLIVLGVGAVALVRFRASSGAVTAVDAPLPRVSPPSAATVIDPIPSMAPAASVSVTESAQSPADQPPAGANSVSVAASALPRPRGLAPRRGPAAPGSSNKAAPSLDIRLQR